MSKILITGATGPLGGAVAQLLLDKSGPQNLAVLVRDAGKATRLKEAGVDVRVGDYNDKASLVKAFTGISKLYFVSGNDVFNRTQQHENVVNAAKEAGVKQVVYTSFMRKNETETSPIALVAGAHIKTEQWLKASGMDYTILKHNLYMDLLPDFIGGQVFETGVIYQPAGEGKTAFTLREDMAAVGAHVLSTDGHANKSYDITSDKAYTYTEIAALLSALKGQTISYVSPTAEAFIKTLSEAGVPAEQAAVFAGFGEAIRQGEFAETGSDIETLTGRKPTALADYLQQVYAPASAANA